MQVHNTCMHTFAYQEMVHWLMNEKNNYWSILSQLCARNSEHRIIECISIISNYYYSTRINSTLRYYLLILTFGIKTFPDYCDTVTV